MRFKMMALAATISFTVPALAQTTDSTTPAPKPKKEKKICRRGDANSYSHMTPSICRTQAEWDRNGSTSTAQPGVRSMGGDNLPSR